jgi:hypothetical protein
MSRRLTWADLVLRWSSPRIHWLPWADLGSLLTKKSLRALRKRKTAHRQVSGGLPPERLGLPCTHNQV